MKGLARFPLSLNTPRTCTEQGFSVTDIWASHSEGKQENIHTGMQIADKKGFIFGSVVVTLLLCTLLNFPIE